MEKKSGKKRFFFDKSVVNLQTISKVLFRVALPGASRFSVYLIRAECLTQAWRINRNWIFAF